MCTLVNSYGVGHQKVFAQTVALRVGRGRRNEAREMFHQYVKLLAATAERLHLPVPLIRLTLSAHMLAGSCVMSKMNAHPSVN